MSYALQHNGIYFKSYHDFLDVGGSPDERGIRAMACDMAYGRDVMGLRLRSQLADGAYCSHWKQRIGRINTKRVLALAEEISIERSV